MSLTQAQVDALLKPINPRRVLHDNKGHAHLSQQDVRAHLTRIFGFGGWSSEVLNLAVVREAPGQDKNGNDKGWAVTYRALVKLTIRDPEGKTVCSYEDVATGTSPNLPTLGDAHDFASKVAVSMALKRAATNLGDGFGLSLYNKGQTSALVIGTLVMPEGAGKDASDDVPAQISMGHDDAGSAEPTDDSAQTSIPPQAPAVSSPPPQDDPPAEPPAAISPDVDVEALREKVIEAMSLPRQDAVVTLGRIKIDAGKAHALNLMTTTPAGAEVTVNVLIDEAIKHAMSKQKPSRAAS